MAQSKKLIKGLHIDEVVKHLKSDKVGNLEDFYYIMSMLESGKYVSFINGNGRYHIPIDCKCNIPSIWLES